jgi:hypothetical protein
MFRKSLSSEANIRPNYAGGFALAMKVLDVSSRKGSMKLKTSEFKPANIIELRITKLLIL